MSNVHYLPGNKQQPPARKCPSFFKLFIYGAFAIVALMAGMFIIGCIILGAIIFYAQHFYIGWKQESERIREQEEEKRGRNR